MTYLTSEMEKWAFPTLQVYTSFTYTCSSCTYCCLVVIPSKLESFFDYEPAIMSFSMLSFGSLCSDTALSISVDFP